MLKEEVVFVCNTSNASEYCTLHEVVGIRAETVNNVMVCGNVRKGTRLNREGESLTIPNV